MLGYLVGLHAASQLFFHSVKFLQEGAVRCHFRGQGFWRRGRSHRNRTCPGAPGAAPRKLDGWMEDKRTQHQRYSRDVRVGAATAFSRMKRPISANGAESADLPNALNSFFLALRGLTVLVPQQQEGNPWTSAKYCDSPGTDGRWRKRHPRTHPQLPCSSVQGGCK